ncbi:MAG: TatD family hydrolase [Muribaculaceae bacterium]|nr:TatD family hydrolase [Muribaculaceae bacterium]
MTDTHTHIYMPDVFPDYGVEAAGRAIEAGVTRMVFPCVNENSLPAMRKLHEAFPRNTRLALGLHPTDLEGDWRAQLDRMEQMLPGDFAAIGEVGIDLYHDASQRAEQREAFARQLRWAVKHSLPVIIHCREGLDDTLEVLQELKNECELPQLIFHSFTGGPEEVRRIREVCDPLFGINGVVTFKNAPAVREALPVIGLDRMLLETDAPWLSPAPLRGRTNESARIPLIRDCIAATLGVSPEEVESRTDSAAYNLFFK